MTSPASLQLFAFPKGKNEPSSSGFCQKLETILRASGFKNYSYVEIFHFNAPRKLLPYIELTHPNGKVETIADSHFIMKRLIDLGIIKNIDASLTPSQKGETLAWEHWLGDRVYATIVHTRWLRDHNYEASKAALSIPYFARPLMGWYLRRNISGRLYSSGIRYTEEEVDITMQEWVDSFDARLQASKYFHGDEPTFADAISYGFLSNSLGMQSNKEFVQRILEKPRLKEYVAELTKIWFPEYEGVLKLVQA